MADTLKTLGQASLAATTLTDVYTVPASTSATLSSIVVCNRGGTATTFRVSIAVAGAANANEQYLYYDQAIDANSTFIATIGVTIGAADVVRAYTAGASVSVNVFGVEVI